MFVSVVCEFSNEDHAKNVYELLRFYGFENVMRNVFDSVKIKEESLKRLKRDIDRATDSYDIVRFYQYPMQDTLVISSLKAKKWRKKVFKI